MHSAWGFPGPDGEVRRWKPTAKPTTGFCLNVTTTDVEALWDFGERLGEAERKLWEFVPLER